MLEMVGKRGERIRSLEDWRTFAPPAAAHHWREGFSAYELARVWTGAAGVPEDVVTALDAVPALANFSPTGPARPERVTALPYRGNGRNHDLLVTGAASGGSTVLGVEGKSRESFGEPVRQASAASQPSNRPARVEALAQVLFGAPATTPPVAALRYQLLAAAVGTLLEAEAAGCEQAVLLVHELLPRDAEDDAVRRNAADLEAFVAVLGGGPGPFTPRPTTLVDVHAALFVVKVRTAC